MRQALFFDGQDVQPADLQEIEDSKSTELKRRMTDISLQDGIITGLAVTNPIAYTLRTAPGTAYDSNGEAIIIGANQDVVVSALNIGQFLVARYAQVDGTNREHYITGVLHPTRRTDSFQVLMVVTPLATDVILASLTTLDGSGNAVIDSTVRQYWTPRIGDGTITDTMLDPGGAVIAHINSLGTGIVSPTNPHGQTVADLGFVSETTPHQLNDHSNGIEPQSATTCALVAVNSAPAPDQLTIVQMTGSDSIIVNGVRLTPSTPITPTTLTFGAGPVNPCLYEIYLNSGGAAAASIRAQYSGAKNAIGVQVVDVSPDHATGSYNLTYNSGAGTLQWDSGPTELAYIASGDKFITLRRAANADHWIKVWVDVSSLPGGTPVDAITISASVETESTMVLANVPWSGTATGFLGYGDHNTSGQALDKRTRGNLGYRDLNDKTIVQLIERVLFETRPDGHAFGNIPTNGGGLNLNLTAGVAYVGGRRLVIPSQTYVMPAGADIYAVYVKADGTITHIADGSLPIDGNSYGFDVDFGPGGDPNARRQAPIAFVTVSGGAITAVLDYRRLLPEHGNDWNPIRSHSFFLHNAMVGDDTNTFWSGVGVLPESVLGTTVTAGYGLFDIVFLRAGDRVLSLAFDAYDDGSSSMTVDFKRADAPNNGTAAYDLSTIATQTVTNQGGTWTPYALAFTPFLVEVGKPLYIKITNAGSISRLGRFTMTWDHPRHPTYDPSR